MFADDDNEDEKELFGGIPGTLILAGIILWELSIFQTPTTRK